ncbi:prohead [Vibrio phage EniLVp02]
MSNDTLEQLVQAAVDGKALDFDRAFDAVMATKAVERVDAIKAEVGASVMTDGESLHGGDEDEGGENGGTE